MSNHPKTRRVLQIGLGVALTFAFAFASGCAAEPAGDLGPAVDESTGETRDALNNVGIYRCSMASGTILGSLVVKFDGTCTRIPTPLPGSSGLYCPFGTCPSCWTLARDLGCILTN